MKHLLAAAVLLSIPMITLAEDDLRIVVLGDSITRGVRGGVTAEQTFGHLLQTALRERKIKATVINSGVGSEQSDQALARLEKTVIAKKPAVVVIMYGTNDSYVYPKKTAANLTAEQFRANLLAIIEKLRAAKIQPVLMTEPCWGAAASKNAVGQHHNVGLAKYMDVTREVAQKTKTPLVDNFAHWTAQQKAGVDVGKWTTDQCHPNPRGHDEIAKLLIPVVAKMVESPKGP